MCVHVYVIVWLYLYVFVFVLVLIFVFVYVYVFAGTETPVAYPCKKCGQSFATVWYLTKHRRETGHYMRLQAVDFKGGQMV